MLVMSKNIVVIGCAGAIGGAFVEALVALYAGATLHAFSRKVPLQALPNVIYRTIDYHDEVSIAEAARVAAAKAPIDLVMIAVGLLHNEDIRPEKSLRELSAIKFHVLFEANAIIPALIIKHFAPKLRRDKTAMLAALSARVGSVSDNRLGGWYAYRAAKAALNMIIKNTAIEMATTHKHAIIVGLHPGTVDSQLSKPFQQNVPSHRLFSPAFSVQQLMTVLQTLTVAESGKCFAWDGSEIKP